MEAQIRDVPERSRFEAEVAGRTAVVEYSLEPGRIRLVHTGVPEALEGEGLGSRLARHALDTARERGLAVWPECPFIASYIQRHPEYLDLVDDDFPGRDELARGTE